MNSLARTIAAGAAAGAAGTTVLNAITYLDMAVSQGQTGQQHPRGVRPTPRPRPGNRHPGR